MDSSWRIDRSLDNRMRYDIIGAISDAAGNNQRHDD